MGGQSVEETVGADFVGIIDFYVKTPFQSGAGDEGLDVEPVTAEAAKMVKSGWDDCADDGGIDIGGGDVGANEKRLKPNAIFI
jgi:hypothetical protein